MKLGRCKKHPQYKAIHKPVRTRRHPDGCPQCWLIYMKAQGIRVVK